MAGKARTPHRLSIFSQRLDRAILTGYFLGAIVPLVALAFLALRYVVPALPDGPVARGLLGGLGSVAVLTLGSFLLIRRTAQQGLQRMDADNGRLQGLLDASAKLASAKHANDVAGVTAAVALAVTGSTAAFLWMCSDKEGPLSLVSSANGGQPGEAVRARAREAGRARGPRRKTRRLRGESDDASRDCCSPFGPAWADGRLGGRVLRGRSPCERR